MTKKQLIMIIVALLALIGIAIAVANRDEITAK